MWANLHLSLGRGTLRPMRDILTGLLLSFSSLVFITCWVYFLCGWEADKKICRLGLEGACQKIISGEQHFQATRSGFRPRTQPFSCPWTLTAHITSLTLVSLSVKSPERCCMWACFVNTRGDGEGSDWETGAEHCPAAQVGIRPWAWLLTKEERLPGYVAFLCTLARQEAVAAAAAKSLQSCLTLCDPIDGSPPGSPIPGILQARTLEWVAISFSSEWKWKVKVKSLSHVRLLGIPWTAAHQAPPSMGFSRQEYWSCRGTAKGFWNIFGFNYTVACSVGICKWSQEKKKSKICKGFEYKNQEHCLDKSPYNAFWSIVKWVKKKCNWE